MFHLSGRGQFVPALMISVAVVVAGALRHALVPALIGAALVIFVGARWWSARRSGGQVSPGGRKRS